MKCPNCQTEVSQPGTCQNSVYPIALPAKASWGSKNAGWIIAIVVLCFLIGVGAVVVVGYRALQQRGLVQISIALPAKASWGSKNAGWIIAIVVLCFLIGVGAVVVVGYRALQQRGLV